MSEGYNALFFLIYSAAGWWAWCRWRNAPKRQALESKHADPQIRRHVRSHLEAPALLQIAAWIISTVPAILRIVTSAIFLRSCHLGKPPPKGDVIVQEMPSLRQKPMDVSQLSHTAQIAAAFNQSRSKECASDGVKLNRTSVPGCCTSKARRIALKASIVRLAAADTATSPAGAAPCFSDTQPVTIYYFGQ